ncbi:MAG: lysophospholipid acyltransferase family protein [Clostridia bacterium]
MLYILCKIIFTLFVLLIYRPRVQGYHNLFIRGKAILISNHHSLGDPILIAFIAPRLVHFMAKQELFEHPLARFFLKGLLCFPVNRKHADLASLKQAMTVLDKGRVFGIFPEGRRSITGDLDTFEKGAAFLALRCKAPIIPLYSDPQAAKRMRIRMIVGEPMDATAIAKQCAGRSVDTVTDALRDRMQQLRNEMESWNRA